MKQDAKAARRPRGSDGSRRSAAGAAGRRDRSRGLITLAVLLVLGFALATAAWGMRAGEKVSVLAIASGSSVAQGQKIERKHLVSVAVSGVSGAIPVAQIKAVEGKTAAVGLVGGQILTVDMLKPRGPGDGRGTVGLSLGPGRVSAGLEPGDLVSVIAVPATDGAKADPTAMESPRVLAAAAEVYSVQGVSTSGGQVVVTVVVSLADQPRIEAFAAQGRVAIGEVSAQVSTPSAQPTQTPTVSTTKGR